MGNAVINIHEITFNLIEEFLLFRSGLNLRFGMLSEIFNEVLSVMWLQWNDSQMFSWGAITKIMASNQKKYTQANFLYVIGENVQI